MGTASLQRRLRIDRARFFDQIGFEPHGGQVEVLSSDARFKVLVAGRRWGKSKIASVVASEALLVPDSVGWIVSKSYGLSEKVFRQVYMNYVRKLKLPPVRKELGGPYRMEFSWGAVVEGKSAERLESLLGEGLDWVVFDECAVCRHIVWDQYLRPAESDRRGWAMFISTPRGFNWFYDFYQRGCDPSHDLWDSWRYPSWTNPYLPTEEVDEARRTTGEVLFRQEWGAEFTTAAGRVYGDFSESVQVVDHKDLKIEREWLRYRAMDIGYENPTVCLWIAFDPSREVCIIYDEYYETHQTVEQTAEYLVRRDASGEVQNAYVPHFDYVDTQYEWTVIERSAAGARATLASHGIVTVGLKGRADISRGLELVRRYLRIRDDGTPSLLVSSACRNTIKEFLLYSYPDNGTSEVPKKEHDHAMDAIRYFVTLFWRGPAKELVALY